MKIGSKKEQGMEAKNEDAEAEDKGTNCEILAGDETNGKNREAKNGKGEGMKVTKKEANGRPRNNKSRTRGKRRYGGAGTRVQR